MSCSGSTSILLDTTIQMQNNTSNLNIKVSFETYAIQQLIDQYLPDPLLKDFSPPEAKGILINARKNGSIQLEATGNTFKYQIPLQIQAFKSMMFGNIDVPMEILLDMTSQFIIKDDWQFVTKTELINFQWLEKPQLDLGILKLPLDSIIQDVLEKNKKSICQTIDQQVMKQLDIRTPLNNILTKLPNPVVFLETEKVWWQSDAISTSIGPFSTDEKEIKVKLGATTPFCFSYGKKIEVQKPTLQAPDITLELDNNSTLRTSCFIDFGTLENFATSFLQKKEFDIKGQKINIQDVRISGANKKLNIKVQVTGSFDGTVFVAAQPIFNQKDKTIQLQNPELDLKGDNLKSKMISLVAEKAIESKMSEFLNFPIQNALDILNQNITSNKVLPNITIKGNVKNVDIPEIEIEKEGLSLGIIAEGDMSMEMVEVPMV